MLKPNSVLFARLPDPSPYSVGKEAEPCSVAIVNMDSHTSLETSKSLQRFGAKIDIFGCASEMTLGKQFQLVVVAEDGKHSLIDLYKIAKKLNDREFDEPLVLVSCRLEDEKLADALIGEFDAIVGFPFSDENFHYALRRMLSRRSNFPMRHFDAIETNSQRPVLSGWWIIPFAMFGVLGWTVIAGALFV